MLEHIRHTYVYVRTHPAQLLLCQNASGTNCSLLERIRHKLFYVSTHSAQLLLCQNASGTKCSMLERIRHKIVLCFKAFGATLAMSACTNCSMFLCAYCWLNTFYVLPGACGLLHKIDRGCLIAKRWCFPSLGS